MLRYKLLKTNSLKPWLLSCEQNVKIIWQQTLKSLVQIKAFSHDSPVQHVFEGLWYPPGWSLPCMEAVALQKCSAWRNSIVAMSWLEDGTNRLPSSLKLTIYINIPHQSQSSPLGRTAAVVVPTGLTQTYGFEKKQNPNHRWSPQCTKSLLA